MKKVVQILSDAGIGGGQVLLLNILQNWKKEEVEQILITDIKGHYLPDFQATSHRVYSIDFNASILYILYRLCRIIAKEQPDYVHNHFLRGSLLGSIAARITSKAKIYNQLHSIISDSDAPKWKKELYNNCLKILARQRCHFICVSKYSIKQMMKLGISAAQLHAIYNGVKARNFPFSPKPYPTGSPLKLLFIGRLAHEKGLQYLISAMQKLRSEAIQLSIIGDGYLREILEAQANQNKLENVAFLGFQKDVRSLIAEHHVIVLPSLWEAFGIVIVEGMAMGKAIIGTKVGGIPELLLDEKGGYLCPPADSEALYKAILKIQKNPECLAEFGAFNRARFLELFTLDRTIKELEILYEK